MKSKKQILEIKEDLQTELSKVYIEIANIPNEDIHPEVFGIISALREQINLLTEILDG